MAGKLHTDARRKQNGFSLCAITAFDIITIRKADSYTDKWRHICATREIVIAKSRKGKTAVAHTLALIVAKGCSHIKFRPQVERGIIEIPSTFYAELNAQPLTANKVVCRICRTDFYLQFKVFHWQIVLRNCFRATQEDST